MGESQTAAHVLMIRPVRFARNSQTAPSNRFQQLASDSESRLQTLAHGEFEALTDALRSSGVGVLVLDDTLEPHTPDSIFPNNWVSFHADATAVLYPMLAPNRRLERRPQVLDLVIQQGFHIERIVDLTHHEQQHAYLEGTGSLVLDRVNRVAYACLSPRTHRHVLADFARQLDYELVSFEACDAEGTPIYHTNVMLSIGARFAVVCTASVHVDQRRQLLQRLASGGRAVLELNLLQMQAFAGNLLEVRTLAGEPVVAMSERAFNALDADQRRQLVTWGGRIVTAAIPTIEHIGGGSVRCMLAEIHLPRASSIHDPVP